MFRLDCFKIEEGNRVNKTVYLNPAFVSHLEADHRITKVITNSEDYYTTAKPEHIIEGLKNVQESNHKIVLFN